ncbi:MAG: hypothetical protein RL839_16775 [Gammaproteobacteria bacterium]
MTKTPTPTTILLAVVLGAYLWTPPAEADNGFEPRLTEYGQPDLQGVWYFGSTTPFTRPAELGEQATYTADEIRQLEQEAYSANQALEAPLDPDRAAPEAGAFVGFEADFNFANRRHRRSKVGDEYRTSLVVEPSDGQLPAREDFQDFAAVRRANGFENYSSAQASDSGERCLTGGLPIPSLYPLPWNANLQIVQNKDYVVLLTEMIHDARIVKLSGQHLGEHMNYWNGDSVAYWEDQTLVVHSKNFRPEHSSFLMRMSEDLQVIERFTPLSDDEILYRVEIEDMQAFTEPFVVERSIRRRPVDEPLYEFACHEGNYAMKYMLMGARRAEVDAEFNIEN